MMQSGVYPFLTIYPPFHDITPEPVFGRQVIIVR